MLREIFPHGRFAPPATEANMAAVETALGVRFPEPLRALYLETNGFREDRGNASYLFPLTGEAASGSLLTHTRFAWEEAQNHWPGLDLTPFIFFGTSGADELWGIHGQQIIAFSFHWEEGEYQVVGSSILDVYQADYARYEE
jgi:hypothetical protein